MEVSNRWRLGPQVLEPDSHAENPSTTYQPCDLGKLLNLCVPQFNICKMEMVLKPIP